MRFQLLISCNNAAFGEDPAERDAEVRRILRRAHDDLRGSGVRVGEEHSLRDANGNTVGSWAFVADAAAFEACNSCPWPSQCADRGSCEAGQ